MTVPGITRSEVLQQAEGLINGPRAQEYGSPKVNFGIIAHLWKPIFGVEVTDVQVAMAMSQVKVARLIQSPTHEDSWIDAAGYMALGGELATSG